MTRKTGLFVLALMLGVLAMPSSSHAAGRYISNYDIGRHLREDCREIVRKAKFYISARCSFKVLAVDRGGPVAAPGFSRRPAPSLNPSTGTGLGSDLPDETENYSPSIDMDLTRREQRISATRERAQALATDDDTPKKGRWSHMRVLARSKGFIRDVTFEVVYRLKWTPSNVYYRTVLKVLPRPNNTLQSGTSSRTPQQQRGQSRQPSSSTTR